MKRRPTNENAHKMFSEVVAFVKEKRRANDYSLKLK
jgi:hypothetical protein